MIHSARLHYVPNPRRAGGGVGVRARHRLQPFRFAPSFSDPRPCLARDPVQAHVAWRERWHIPFKPKHHEWVVPVVIFLLALGYELRTHIQMTRTSPWIPQVSVLAHTERALELPVDAQRFPLNQQEALADVLFNDSTIPPRLAQDLAGVIWQEARAQGYDPFLALAIMRVESSFRLDAVSPRGAEGLMQLMPQTERWLIDTGPTLSLEETPVTNVRLGMRYFGGLQRSFRGRLDLALAAYNCGPARLHASLRDAAPLPKETQAYATKVMLHYHRLRSGYEYLNRPAIEKPIVHRRHLSHQSRH